MLKEVKANPSELKEYQIVIGDKTEVIRMYCQDVGKGLLYKFDINNIPRLEMRTYILGSLIYEALTMGMVPVMKTDMRKTVKDLALPVLFVNLTSFEE